MRIEYGLQATALQYIVGGHGNCIRRDHDRARRKRIFIDYHNGRAGSGMQPARSWSGLHALQPPVEGRGNCHDHPYALRRGITKSLGLAFAFLPGESRARGSYLDRAASMKSLGLAAINEGSV